METLNNAARAAGFAMAASDELLKDTKAEPTVETDAWRPGEAIVQSEPSEPGHVAQAVTDWLKGRVFGLFGRRAPA